jgi:putative flippase GtrA
LRGILSVFARCDAVQSATPCFAAGRSAVGGQAKPGQGIPAKKLSFALLFMPRQFVIKAVDFFYPPFRRFLPLQTFRYAACGAFNTVMGLVVYDVMLLWILKGRPIDLGFFMFRAHTASLIVACSYTYLMGFLLSKYVVFVDSDLRGRVQLFRYTLTFFFNFLLNFLLLKLLVDLFHWNASLSQKIITAIVILVNYLSQKHFTFRSKG